MQNELTAERVEMAIAYMEEMRSLCDTQAGNVPKAYNTALAALREVQERERGCEYCNDYEDLPEHIINGKPVGKVFDTSITCDERGRWHIELPSGNDIGISICPYCGRRLTEGREEEMSFKQIKDVEAVFIDGNEIIITGCPADSAVNN